MPAYSFRCEESQGVCNFDVTEVQSTPDLQGKLKKVRVSSSSSYRG